MARNLEEVVLTRKRTTGAAPPNPPGRPCGHIRWLLPAVRRRNRLLAAGGPAAVPAVPRADPRHGLPRVTKGIFFSLIRLRACLYVSADDPGIQLICRPRGSLPSRAAAAALPTRISEVQVGMSATWRDSDLPARPDTT